MLRRLVSFDFLRTNFDMALLVLRVGMGINLFLKHGLEKIVYFNQGIQVFVDPLGIGHSTTFLMAFFSDTICSLLFIIGVGTRWWCMYCFGLICGAWYFRHHMMYFSPMWGPNHLSGDHGELIVLFLIILLTIFIAGPGRYSIDARLKDSVPLNKTKDI